MGKAEWMIAVLAAGLAAGVAWIRHRRQTGRDSYLPLWRPFVWLAGWLALILGIIGIFLLRGCPFCAGGKYCCLFWKHMTIQFSDLLHDKNLLAALPQIRAVLQRYQVH